MEDEALPGWQAWLYGTMVIIFRSVWRMAVAELLSAPPRGTNVVLLALFS